MKLPNIFLFISETKGIFFEKTSEQKGINCILGDFFVLGQYKNKSPLFSVCKSGDQLMIRGFTL